MYIKPAFKQEFNHFVKQFFHASVRRQPRTGGILSSGFIPERDMSDSPECLKKYPKNKHKYSVGIKNDLFCLVGRR